MGIYLRRHNLVVIARWSPIARNTIDAAHSPLFLVGGSMAHPRVFISSTFYDLRQVRADLERFIRDMGFDPVLNERGSVPYGNEEKLEEYCYKEIELCDILLSIVGGRFGTGSQHEPYSISQMELKTALRLGRPVYIFVERGVLSEYSTYLKNKEVKKIVYSFVDDIRVYRFLDEVHALPNNNPIAPFETTQDIISYLKEQWAGLLQRLLHENRGLGEADRLRRIETTANTLNQLVTFLTEERRNKDQAIQDILLSNHPAFEQLRGLTNTPYRVFFTTRDELEAWLNARSYKDVAEESWDAPDFQEWTKEAGEGKYSLLKVRRNIFGPDGRLKVFTNKDWKPEWILKETRKQEEGITDSEIPY
jgi:hypothetical protein